MTPQEIKEAIVDHKLAGWPDAISPDKLATYLHGLEERIEALENSLLDCPDEDCCPPAHTPKEPSVWEPKEGDRYTYFTLREDTWFGDKESDTPRRDFLGVYPTREAAEKAAEAIRLFIRTLKV